MRPARSLALITALIALAAILLQLRVDIDRSGDPVAVALWSMARYFTILTNALVVVVLGRAGLTGRMPPALTAGGLTAWILLVGIVYHLLLARPLTPFSLAWWADHGLHTAVPSLALIWWLVFAPKSGLRPDAPARWLIWPVGYTVYVLTRGLIDGRYPYFFFDIGRFGIAQVAINSAGLALGFFLAGHLLRLVAKAIARG